MKGTNILSQVKPFKGNLRDAVEKEVSEMTKSNPKSEIIANFNQDHDGRIFDTLEQMWKNNKDMPLSYEEAEKLKTAVLSLPILKESNLNINPHVQE